MNNPIVESNEDIIKKTLRYGIVLTLLFLIAVIVVFSIYLINFHGGLSGNSQDWGAFGSYFGGVLAPIVAFFSTIAIIYTIYLQKKILRENQVFAENTINQQKQLIEQSNAAHLELTKENYRNRLLETVETRVRLCTEEKKSLQDEISNIYAVHLAKGDPAGAERHTKTLKIERTNIDGRLNRLTLFSAALSVMKFKSINDINDWFLAKAPESFAKGFRASMESHKTSE